MMIIIKVDRFRRIEVKIRYIVKVIIMIWIKVQMLGDTILCK